MRRAKDSRGGQRRGGRGEGGFTLIELMIVVAIIAALTAVAIVAYTRHLKNARVVEGHNLVGRVQMLQEAYFARFGTYCNASGLAASITVASTNVYPLLTASEPEAKVWAPGMPGGWTQLGFRFDRASIYWGLAIVAGDQAGGYAVGGTAATTAFNLPAGRPWHYVMAWADLDGDSSNHTRLWATSVKRQPVIWDKGR